jgi:peptidyl-prolyl cis-trans isomerase SurA
MDVTRSFPLSRKRKRALGLTAVLAAAAIFTAVFTASRTSDASIVERVVAVVGERPILLSDLRKRARPYLVHIHATTPNAAQQAAQETEMFREVLNRMIDDRLEEQAADKARLSVPAEEIDRGIKNKADSLNIAVRELLAEAKRQGLSEQDYRDEIRRQILEGKLIQLRVMTRVRLTEEDGRAAYVHWVKEIGDEKLVDIRILALRLPVGGTQEQNEARMALAQSLVTQARAGADFCALVKQYSDDVTTKGTCGSRGMQPLASLQPQLVDAATTMKEGQTSDPILFGGEAIVVTQLHKAPGIPAYEDVKMPMQERAMGEAIDRQRKMWLQELRRGVYIDVRL